MAAIYQWSESDVQELTTTLYPLEAVEELVFTADLDAAFMVTVPGDAADIHSAEVISVSKLSILLDLPLEEDSIDIHATTVVSVSKLQILIDLPLQEDAMDIYTTSVIDVTKAMVLVTAYSPDHGLVFTADVDTANCSMTPV